MPVTVESYALYKSNQQQHKLCEPVWPGDKSLGWKALGSNPLRLSFLFKSCGLWTLHLSCDSVPHNYETLKMALIAAHLSAEVILVVAV